MPEGCIFGLVGLNGAGKTTFIKCLPQFRIAGRNLLMLDEPMSGLDPRARAYLKAEIKAAHRRGADDLRRRTAAATLNAAFLRVLEEPSS